MTWLLITIAAAFYLAGAIGAAGAIHWDGGRYWFFVGLFWPFILVAMLVMEAFEE